MPATCQFARSAPRCRSTTASPPTIITDVSYGFIPIRWEKDHPQYLLLHSAFITNPRAQWEFPKGHGEPGETPIQSACREFREETGLSTPTILTGFESSYSFFTFKPGMGRIRRTVHLFLGFVWQGETAEVPTAEHSVDQHGRWAQWLQYPDALATLFLPERQQALNEAHRFICGNELHTHKGVPRNTCVGTAAFKE